MSKRRSKAAKRLERRKKYYKQRQVKEFEKSMHPTFDATEQEEIKRYQAALRNIPEVKIICWNCGETYTGDRCPYCSAFKPRKTS